MGRLSILVVLLASIVTFRGYWHYQNAFGDRELAYKIPSNIFWGPKGTEGEKEDKSVKPFKVNVEEKLLKTLKEKLKEELNSGRFTSPLEGIGFEYGFNSGYLKEVLSYWLNKYDWRSREKLLNEHPNFKTKIAGLNIHFQHVKSKDNGKYKKTLPILVIHGWPGSFIEHQKLIPLLTDPAGYDLNFEVIIPSLPGYGFSDGAARPGLGPVEIGQLFVELMVRLGHKKFYIQAGDWGASIANYISILYPKKVIGYHSNTCFSFHPRVHLYAIGASLAPSYFLSPQEQARFGTYSNIWSFMIRETGYMHIQATKPDTVGAGLSHSPTGLAAYILEKFSGWTNKDYITKPDGQLTHKFKMDELLDNIMVYWVTNSITTSMRLYSEHFSPNHMNRGIDSTPTNVPYACLFPGTEPFALQTESMVRNTFHNIVRFTYADGGGHFFSLEQPEVLAKDVLTFVRLLKQ